jgi:hypothetical protein
MDWMEERMSEATDWLMDGTASVDSRPRYYYPDGKPIVDNELFPDFLQWAMLFEQRDGDRIVGQTKTLYGEKLSTVWLGMDHASGGGKPLIFETMLFAPDKDNVRLRSLHGLFRAMKGEEVDTTEYDAYVAYTRKRFPHDQLQLRYSTRHEAEDSYSAIKLQCLIPPRWRHFLLWTIGRIEAWKHFEDEDEE